MKIGTMEAFKQLYEWTPTDEQRAKGSVDCRFRDEAVREERKKRFPYSVIVECNYPEMDFAIRWTWNWLGPRDGRCHESGSEYPACELVKATETVKSGTDQEGNPWSYKEYANVPDHAHSGVWSALWLGKTGYDYGYMEFYFSSEADLQKFVDEVPKFTLGENYD